ncbi:MAG: histidine--tRNA ligase [Synergistaceae bacterium]|nr:histidine--tRNA ligase [Synergistaceae bacterium]
MDMKAPRGVRDILPEESWKWAYILKILGESMNDYGYSEVHLPIFEHTELFARGVGDTTDIVEKEMYTFIDRGGRSITLRPEATASIVRLCLENNLCGGGAPLKVWTAGPMFRYERPQKGRFRQFWQIDAECLGVASPYADAEIIALSIECFHRLGLRNLEVVINSVGCPACRPAYREKLIKYFKSNIDQLCELCLSRLERNPLRLLDCKIEGCSNITDDAPSSIDNLCKECSEHFSSTIKLLESSDISYKIDKKLVRGLDYYTKTAYEILSGELGAQNAVCGGGRYDNLSETIGGPRLHGVGFAAGIERIALVMEQQQCSFGKEPKPQVYVISFDKNDELIQKTVYNLTMKLRENCIATEMDLLGRSAKTQLKSAASSGARFACIIGPEEVGAKNVSVKDLVTGRQELISEDNIIKYFHIFFEEICSD